MEINQLDEAKIAQREYMRKWRTKNPEKVKAAQMRYWAKKAAETREAFLIKDEERANSNDRST